MTIPQTAIDAAAEALYVNATDNAGWLSDIPREQLRVSRDETVVWLDAGSIDVGQIVEEALTAALPHIREQIAQEIETAAATYYSRADHRHDMQDALLEERGMSIAARIVRGEA